MPPLSGIAGLQASMGDFTPYYQQGDSFSYEAWLDGFQTSLDVAGIADPFGIADGVNAVIYAGRGQWADAGISAMGIIPYVGDVAKSSRLASNAVRLTKKLASESQMAEIGQIIIRSDKLRDAAKLAEKYGGNATDWVKKTSQPFTINGVKFETHWYENLLTGAREEYKTKFIW